MDGVYGTQRNKELVVDRLLRLKQVIAPSGPVPVSKSTWWLWTRTGYAPAPVRISKRVTAWRESDVRAFIARHSA